MCEMKNGEKSRLSPGFMARLVGECSILNIHEHNVEHRLQTHIVLGAGEKFLDKTISNKNISFILKKEMEKNVVSKFSKEETWR